MNKIAAVLLSFSLSASAADFTQKDLNEESVIAANWQQFAAEYDALFYQTFNMARDNLAEALKKVPEGRKPAIVTDIDDTLLEGVSYFTSLIGTSGQRTVERSRLWWNSQPLNVLPGTLEFFREAQRQGIEIFYTSGRFNDVKAVTYRNLTSLGFPVRNKDRILLQPAGNVTLSKEERCQSIRDQGYHIIMKFGDQLDDLAEVQRELYPEKQAWVANNREKFANQWFLLPNIIYGSWESALARGYNSMPPGDRHQARINALLAGVSLPVSNQSDPEFAQHLTLASVWYYTSADYRALTYQAYNHATSLISRQLTDRPAPAVILDIDGTVLDMSPLPARATANQKASDIASHSQWVMEQNMTALPGSLAFLSKAKKNGYEIFYLSDRPLTSKVSGQKRDLEKATVGNLKKLGFPDADDTHVILKQEYCPQDLPDCGKEFKRKAIQTGKVDGVDHQVFLYVGDQMTDFDLVEQGLKPGSKEDIGSVREQFGRHYIILPNPTQYTWMRRLYSDASGMNYTEMSSEEKVRIRRQLVRDWPGKPD
ncbi:MAG: HAD family acid phosphatase [Endozoicomonas sp.]